MIHHLKDNLILIPNNNCLITKNFVMKSYGDLKLHFVNDEVIKLIQNSYFSTDFFVLKKSGFIYIIIIIMFMCGI